MDQLLGTSHWHSHKNSQILEECIIFCFPLNSDAIQVLNFCLLYTKYYNYIQCLFHGNKLDLYACLAQLKSALKIEYILDKGQTMGSKRCQQRGAARFWLYQSSYIEVRYQKGGKA